MEDDSVLSGNWLWLDFNGDRRLSTEDASGWFFHALFLPGEVAIDLLIAVPALASLLDLGTDSYGGVASKTISVMFWIAVLMAVGAVWNFLRDLDRALTGFVARRWEDFRRSLRVIRRIFTSWIGLQIQRRRARVGHIDVAELELQKLEEAVLRCYASLGEERTLAALDVSQALRVSVRSAQKALLKLVRYRLLQPVFEPSQATPAYQITQAGQIFLLER